MKSYTQKMEDHLEVDGWEIEEKFVDDLEWWADEIWRIVSIWSPVGCKAHLTFLVDPQHEGSRNKGEAVWAIGASKAFPTSRFEAEGITTIALNKQFKNNILDFSLEMEPLRISE